MTPIHVMFTGPTDYHSPIILSSLIDGRCPWWHDVDIGGLSVACHMRWTDSPRRLGKLGFTR